MKLSTKSRYALEALLYMALYSGGRPMRIAEIAAGTGISEGYLEQIFFCRPSAGKAAVSCFPLLKKPVWEVLCVRSRERLFPSPARKTFLPAKVRCATGACRGPCGSVFLMRSAVFWMVSHWPPLRRHFGPRRERHENIDSRKIWPARHDRSLYACARGIYFPAQHRKASMPVFRLFGGDFCGAQKSRSRSRCGRLLRRLSSCSSGRPDHDTYDPRTAREQYVASRRAGKRRLFPAFFSEPGGLEQGRPGCCLPFGCNHRRGSDAGI